MRLDRAGCRSALALNELTRFPVDSVAGAKRPGSKWEADAVKYRDIERSIRLGLAKAPTGLLGLAAVGLAVATGLTVGSFAIVGGSSHGSPRPPTAATTVAAKITIKTASVAGLGTVLVDGAGRTLYTLTSEASGKITCTTSSGCPTYWPQLNSRKGQGHQVHGGARAALMGSEKGAGSRRQVTYHGHPLYTYSGDSGAGQSNGEGLKSFGGTWYAVSASGSLVKAAVTATSPTSGAGGY